MQPIELEERLIEFAVRIVRVTANLPKSVTGKHFAGQLLRSGTAPAPNYAEARGAESRADFVHKIGVVLKELNETSVWLKIIQKTELVDPKMLEDLLNENQQPCRIFVAQIKTAKNGLSESKL